MQLEYLQVICTNGWYFYEQGLQLKDMKASLKIVLSVCGDL